VLRSEFQTAKSAAPFYALKGKVQGLRIK